MRIEGENREKWRDFLEWRKKETLTVDKNGCGKKKQLLFLHGWGQKPCLHNYHTSGKPISYN